VPDLVSERKATLPWGYSACWQKPAQSNASPQVGAVRADIGRSHRARLVRAGGKAEAVAEHVRRMRSRMGVVVTEEAIEQGRQFRGAFGREASTRGEQPTGGRGSEN